MRLQDDLTEVLDSNRDETTKKRLVNARLGQGGFREALLEAWGLKCALTGCRIPEVLRASHIKAWSASNDDERLDPLNGILLAASVDALFDKFLITFAADGSLKIAAGQDVSEFKRLGIDTSQSVDLGLIDQRYMEWHREEFQKRTAII